jgi:Ca-activated chloride channel homolog
MMKKILVVIFLLISLLIDAQQVAKNIRRGNRDYADEKFNEAELFYRKALEKAPESDKATYNLGNALYKQDQFEPATTKFESLLQKETDPKILSKYYYNLGNSYFKSQKLEKSIEAYKQSLRLNPVDQDAKHNLFLAQNMLKQQQNQQNKQDKQNQKEKNDQNKDQQQDQQKQQQDQKESNPKDQQMSKEDAERLLEALEQDEKDVLKKVEEQKMQVRKIPVDKEW